jgi:hypothetical protein
VKASGTPETFFATAPVPATYTGQIQFENAAGRSYGRRFRVSAESFRTGFSFDEEAPRTMYELQKLLELLEEIAKEIRALHPDAP